METATDEAEGGVLIFFKTDAHSFPTALLVLAHHQSYLFRGVEHGGEGEGALFSVSDVLAFECLAFVEGSEEELAVIADGISEFEFAFAGEVLIVGEVFV